MFESILHGFALALEWANILAMIAGVAIGIIMGALPGLSGTMAIALLLPITYGMPAGMAMLLLIGIYCGGVYGGSISAILLKTPGTLGSVATVSDGFALAQQGKASTALNISIYASVAGGLISGLVLLSAAPQVAQFALKFGPSEYFMLALFGVTIISSVSGKYLSKGLVMGCLGMLIGTVGMDPISGGMRFTFGTNFLQSGIELIPALIGLFAIAEILNQIERGSQSIAGALDFKNEKFRLRDMLPLKKTIFKGSIIGVIIGMIPGTGGAISSFLSYSEARRTSQDPDSFGKGNMHGVAAAESSNNGTTGTTLIPMMTMGIPGDTVTAVLLGALTIQGLVPGPQLFTSHGNLVYTIICGFLIINIILLVEAKLAIRLFAKVTLVPSTILLPVILGLCLVGAYTVSNSMYSVIVMLIFGLIGYVLPKYDYPVTPMLLGFILGNLIETSLRQALIISDGSYLIFFQRPISLTFFVLIVLSVVFPLIRQWKKKRSLLS